MTPAPLPDKSLELPGIGPIELVRHPRARRMSLKVRADGTIRLTLPPRATIAQGRAFARAQRAWLAGQLERQNQKLEFCQKLLARHQEFDAAGARAQLDARLRRLAAEHGFHYGRVTFRCQKSRWGSCSARNHLSLNLKLALLPEALCDLVLLHELLHTELKHHGPAFHARLEELLPGAARLARDLKQYAPLLRLPLPKTKKPTHEQENF